MTAPKVFLSHTSRMARLPEGRSFVQAALDALAEADLLPRDMRYFAADDRTPADVCIDAVRRCDVYVGVFGLDYGSPVRDHPEVSYTELEFLTALEEKQKRGMRVFAFLLDKKAAKNGLGPLNRRQKVFRQRVLDSGLTAGLFTNPAELHHLIYRTLKEQLPPPSRRDRPPQSTVKVLFLAANPLGKTRLALDEEFRAIKAKLRGAEYRDRFTLDSEWAVRLGDLSGVLQRHRPQVVHFSGHGESSGAIVLVGSDGQPREVPPDTLAGLFGVLKDDVRVVVLNACYSAAQAQAIVGQVGCALGMSDEVKDDHAVVFAEEFYQALANGRSVRQAFDLGVWRLENEGVAGAKTLVKLHERTGTKASEVVLIGHTADGSAAPAVPVRLLQHRDRRAINFQGREKELEALAADVRAAVANGTSLSFVGIKGMGGIGKTALAAELAERLARELPGGVLWANLQEEAPADAARRWLRDLHHDQRDLGPDECLRQFRPLAGDIRPLVVLDNVPRPGDGGNLAEPLLVKAPGVATLLTTRFREAVPSGVRVQPLDVLPPDEALALLRSHVGPAADNDPAAEEVLRLCECLPLFVNVADRAVANGYYGLADYAEELRGRGLAALAEEDETGRAAVVFDLSWQHLSDQAKRH